MTSLAKVLAPAIALILAPLFSAHAEDAATPKLTAVLVYADWCGSCRVLDPKVEAVKAANTFEDVAFVTLDYTDRDKDAFYAAAEAAGVGEAVSEHLGNRIKTGRVLLIDMDDQTVASTITKRMEPAEIVTTITEAAAAA